LHTVILFSSVEYGAKEKRWIAQIGASVATSSETATHVVTAGFTRSVKIMTAISKILVILFLFKAIDHFLTLFS
jgi:hypothetical protein